MRTVTKRWTMRRAAFCMITVLCCTSLHAATIADSNDDYSFGVQGENNWTNGYYNLTLDEEDGDGVYGTDDFIPFLNDDSNEVLPDGLNHWDGTQWRLYRDGEGFGAGLAQTGPWTRIGEGGNPDFGHPNGTNSAAPTEVDDPLQEEHWAMRRWESTFAGEVSLVSQLAAQNTNGSGTTVHLFHNGTLLDTITNSSPVFSENKVGATIAVGDFIDFALSPEGVDGSRSDGADGSFFRVTVTDDPPPPPVVPPLADSFTDWSTDGVQGERNWFNGYYNLTRDQDDSDGIYQADDFEPFENSEGPGGGPVEPDGNHWNGTQWDLDSQGAPGPWTELGREGTHPNGTNSAPNEEHWTIRRWVANDLAEQTPLEITWNTRKTNLNGGDGVTGKLIVNGQEVDSITVPFFDGNGATRKFYVNANPGDIIDLALTPVGLTNDGDGADGSATRFTVRTTIPEDAKNPTERLADSLLEFSGEQGQDGWTYGYYDQRVDAEDGDGVYTPDEFVEHLNDGSDVVSEDPDFGGWLDSENHWNGSQWDLLNNNGDLGTNHGPWTETTRVGGHPAANAQGDSEVHWAIRRWTSDTEGDVRISGLFNNVSPNGDGTVGRIFVDGEEIWSVLSDGTVEPFDVDLSISQGSVIDFVIDPDGAGIFNPADPFTIDSVNDGNDGTRFYFVIDRIESFGSGVAGDFDGDGLLTAADIDLLSMEIMMGGMGSKFDVNQDGTVDQLDHTFWVEDIKKTWLGDSNLDGEFSSGDLVQIFQAGEYEDEIEDNSGWATGDWNGDKDFDTTDLVVAFQSGGFELGPREGVASVPEPASFVMILVGWVGLLRLRKR